MRKREVCADNYGPLGRDACTSEVSHASCASRPKSCFRGSKEPTFLVMLSIQSLSQLVNKAKRN